jgi:predicted dinucleotide-binding enzyme
MKVGVLGSGDVGQTLAAGFIKYGHDVAIGTRDPARLAVWAAGNAKVRVVSFNDAAAHGEVVVLAVKGTVAVDALRLAGKLDGKTVIDATNPISDLPPQNGVLRYFTNLDESLMERLQRQFPGARFVIYSVSFLALAS